MARASLSWAWFHRLASPPAFYRLTDRWAPWLAIASTLLIGYGLVGGLVLAPADYQQGEAFRIIYVHVPAAWLSLFGYSAMASAAFVAIVWRIRLAECVVVCTAPVGASFTALALVTGMLWGKPMWGTWWEWDPRLTSFLILLLFYLGYMALWSAIENPDNAADLTGVMCLVGSVFAFLSRYAAHFWNQGLHQGSTISVAPGDRISSVYSYPLYLCMLGFFLLFVALALLFLGAGRCCVRAIFRRHAIT